MVLMVVRSLGDLSQREGGETFSDAADSHERQGGRASLRGEPARRKEGQGSHDEQKGIGFMKLMRSLLRYPHGRFLFAIPLAAGLLMSRADSAACADTITDDNVAAAVAAAKTPDEHQALVAFFTAKSELALAEVKRHRRMAGALGSGKQAGSWEAHCHSLAKTYEVQAKDFAALASIQAAMAKAMEHSK